MTQRPQTRGVQGSGVLELTACPPAHKAALTHKCRVETPCSPHPKSRHPKPPFHPFVSRACIPPVRLTAAAPSPLPHREAALGLARHTLLGLDLVRVVPHHKGAHGGAAAPTVPLDQRQLREHAAAPRHDTTHLDEVAEVPRPVGTQQGLGVATGCGCGGTSTAARSVLA